MKQAPDGSGIEKGKAENGLIECAFTPEADISVLVSIPYSLQPLNIQMPPYATVEHVKYEAQRRSTLEKDPDQILAQGRQILNNQEQLRYVFLCG